MEEKTNFDRKSIVTSILLRTIWPPPRLLSCAPRNPCAKNSLLCLQPTLPPPSPKQSLASQGNQSEDLKSIHAWEDQRGALSQNMYIASMKMTSATFATAMTNLIPAMTFILAVIFGLEKLGIKTAGGQAKLAGTLTGLGGAMILTFYRGLQINLWSTTINLLGHKHMQQAMVQHGSSDTVVGSLLAVASCLSIAIWMITQAKMINAYPCHYSTTALMCLMGAIQSTIYALCLNTDMALWRLHFDIRLLTVCYSGILGSGLIFTVMAWCIHQRGPLFASVFSPLLLVLVALAGSLLLDEKLYLGSIIGTVFIVIGLYMVLWGKGREAKAKLAEMSSESTKENAESLRDPLEIVVVDGITISRGGSLDRNASFARNASRIYVVDEEHESGP